MFRTGFEKVAVTLNKIITAYSNAAVDRAVRLNHITVKNNVEKAAIKKALYASKMEDAFKNASNPDELKLIKKLYQTDFHPKSYDWMLNKRYLDNLRSTLPGKEKTYINRELLRKIKNIQNNL